MKSNKSRLDIPGFSYGIKTGELIDVPKIYGGRPQPKKSGLPHSLGELIAEVVSRKQKSKVLFTRLGREDYAKRKRVRTRKNHSSQTTVIDVKPCYRRYFEWTGDKAGWMDYVEEPELFISKSKIAYEITDGLLPMLTVTSAREALIMCASLARCGIAAHFNLVRVPR